MEAKRNPRTGRSDSLFSGTASLGVDGGPHDEKATLCEHFRGSKRQRNGIATSTTKRDAHIETRLMNEMQRRDLDFAVLHHHGDWDTEYLNNLPMTNDTKRQIAQIKKCTCGVDASRRLARHPGRRARARITRRYGELPTHGSEGADDPKVRAADSLYLRDPGSLPLSDFDRYKPECRVVSLDACFNGSFHRDSSIANATIFSPGRTIAVLANSVNVLQDKWVDRYVGLTGLGMSVGNLAKYAPYLNST